MIADLATALGIGTYGVVYFAVWVFVLAIVFVAHLAAGKHIPRSARVAIRLAVVILLVRLVLFDNPWMLRLYLHSLTSEQLGARQAGVLEVEIRKYRRDL